ncbi:MAG: hypothetical protein AAFZ17_08235 [Cyanobacteria bacterium J06650_10]
MAGKKVNFGTKPQKKATVDDWVESREATSESPEQPQQQETADTDLATSEPKAATAIKDEKEKEKKPTMKRLTLDIPENLHRRIKGKAVMEGVTMVNMLRELLEETYG